MASKRLYGVNLAYDVREEQLRELFAPYGPVTAVQIIGTRGFAFVEVPAERLQDAITTLNGSLQFGRPIVVNEARPRANPGAAGTPTSRDRAERRERAERYDRRGW